MATQYRQVLSLYLNSFDNDIFLFQIKDLAMGPSISPVVANIYMEEFQNQSSCHSPRVWKRYVDDIFAVTRVRPFSNSLQPGTVNFTHEVKEKGTLEVQITRTDEGNLSLECIGNLLIQTCS